MVQLWCYAPAFGDFLELGLVLVMLADETLFCKALKDVHCLHHLLPELKTLPVSLFSSGPLITTANMNCTNVLLLSAVFLILIISKIVLIVSLL